MTDPAPLAVLHFGLLKLFLLALSIAVGALGQDVDVEFDSSADFAK